MFWFSKEIKDTGYLFSHWLNIVFCIINAFYIEVMHVQESLQLRVKAIISRVEYSCLTSGIIAPKLHTHKFTWIIWVGSDWILGGSPRLNIKFCETGHGKTRISLK